MKITAAISLFALHFSQTFAAERPDTLVWPSPPDRPRIQHVATISSAANFHEDRGVFSKVLTFLLGGESSTPWLVQPVGIAVSREGVVYVADPGSNGVHRIDEKTKEHALVVETKFGKFRSPIGIACGNDGRVYISDSEDGSVIITDSDLEGEQIIREHLERPTGICLIRDRLCVVDTKKHAVVIFDLKGNYVDDFGHRGDGDGAFNFPIQIAGKDSFFVVDALNYRIQQFDAHGKFQRAFGKQGNALGRFASPKAIAIDSDENLYVTDALLDNVQIFNAQGVLLLSVGGKGSRDGEFQMPNGIAIDGRDRIYVVDTMNRRIQVFQYLK